MPPASPASAQAAATLETALVHTLGSAEVCRLAGVDPAKGLSAAECRARLERYGRNELPAPEPTPFLKLVLKQFEDLMVLILLAAAAVSFVLALFEEGEDRLTAFMEPAVILVILAANATVGVMQETNAEKSIEALRKGEARHANAVRDGGVLTSVDAAELVPGDVVVVDVGDKVPADCRLVEVYTSTLAVDEAMLTGENLAAQKDAASTAAADCATGDKHNMLFSGTLVVRGKARAVVVGTGARTAMGTIAKSLDVEDDSKTPLQEKLDEFGEQLSKVIMVICIVVWLINIGHFTDPEHGSFVRGAVYYFKIAVALAVAAIPEGLPAVVTTCLALGTIKMARKNAIVRSLPSVETLGCTTVICSDKTGTLTTNMMSVQRVFTVSADAGLHDFAVEGDSFAPYGRVTDARAGGRVLLAPAAEHALLDEVARVCVLCNEATLTYDDASSASRDGSSSSSSSSSSKSGQAAGVYGKTGVPTEAALLVLAEKLGPSDQAAAAKVFASEDPRIRVAATSRFHSSRAQRVHLLEFDRDRKSMSVVVRAAQGACGLQLLCKGAPETAAGVQDLRERGVVDRCSHVRNSQGRVVPLTAELRAAVLQRTAELASQGLRCMALAVRDSPPEAHDWSNAERYAEVENGMTLVGVVGMKDPPRPGVRDAIARCRTAGIRVIVITGDHPATAEQICREIGVFGENEDLRGKSFVGKQFQAMTDAEKGEALRSASLFSRVEPIHKQALLQILKSQGEVTAMTGDGINDAPALKAASIGVAMGSGTDVAREASDMVLQDDNFATIVMAVEEGRAIYVNCKQFIRYLISSNIGEVACIFMTAAAGMPEALVPVQLLWVNLVTDGFPATALGFNKADKDIMLQKPRDRDDGIINGWMFFRYMCIGVYVGFATVGGYAWWNLYYEAGPKMSFAQLTHFSLCGKEGGAALFPAGFDCSVFHTAHPSTMSLSILVISEMLNAFNALSENQSLLVVRPYTNPWLLLAVCLSLSLHMVVVYTPFFNTIFHVAPLTLVEWKAVFAFSGPVIFIDEILKFVTRRISVLASSSAPGAPSLLPPASARARRTSDSRAGTGKKDADVELVVRSPHFPAAPVARPYSPRRAAELMAAGAAHASAGDGERSLFSTFRSAAARVGSGSVAAARRMVGMAPLRPDSVSPPVTESDKHV